MKLKPARLDDDELWGWRFYCPGCRHGHVFFVKSWQTKNGPTPAWDFNGSQDKPTFTPSLLNTCPKHPDPKQQRCHLNLTDGRLVFHPDSAHDLAGKTVDLEDRWPDEPT